MQKKILDKGFNLKYFALAGAVIILFVIISTFQTNLNTIEKYSDSELICELQEDVDEALFIMENASEDDLYCYFLLFSNCADLTELTQLTDNTFLIPELLDFNHFKNYSKGDLSPPL